MLILSRKKNEVIIISGNIYVRVLGVSAGRVILGISAPKEITVVREELLERDKQQGEKKLVEASAENGEQ